MKSATELALEQALARWEKANFGTLQQESDVQFREMAQRVEESDRSRKKLVEFTREAKKAMTEEGRKLLGPVLRQYQGEIDSLGRRAKAAEAAYLLCYNTLSDVPDPVPLLRDCLLQLAKTDSSELIEENKRLSDKLALYQQEIAEVRNQDVTINTLRARLRQYETSAQESLEEAVERKVEEMARQHADQLAELQGQHQETLMRLRAAQASVDELVAARETAQGALFEARARYEEELASVHAQMELVSVDAERHAQNVLEISKQRDALLAQLNQSEKAQRQPVQDTTTGPMVAALEAELAGKEREIGRLIGDCQRLQTAMATMQAQHQATTDELEEHIRECEAEMASQQAHIEGMADYHEVKRQLNILKMVEFKIEEGAGQTEKSLELLLLGKNKQLNALVTELNINLADREQQVARLEGEVRDLQKALHDATETATALRADLFIVQGRCTAAPTAPAASTTPLLVQSLASDQPTQEEAEVVVPMGEDSTQLSMLDIVSSQRDRFRDRIDALEATNRQLQQRLSEVSGEMAEVRGDNVKLYEKIKFLQSYPAQQQRREGPGQDETVDKYRSQYEETMSPFAQFHQTERNRRYAGLSTAEKATLGVTHFVLSNKTTRKFIFFYAVLLHVLVLVVLYAYSYSATPPSDDDCLARFQQHMLTHEAEGH
eukprot:comp19970_c0_seq1/m.24351 comp19970_c0_seq1/g.24351  ORF comp19970_c0_seq1/g.24351 comp19970_c0_seq1/m.24351 type:complete len:665 (-) comp19970_c0_seq1:461-2455(-)